MSDFTLQPKNTLIFGMQGSGKTTFGLSYLTVSNCACRFIFDWNERVEGRVPFKTCYTAADLEAALPSRWVIFNPKRMFEGAMFDTKTGKIALRFFARWIREVVKRGPGKKFVMIAELWNFCTADSIPTELAMLAQDGRQDEVELVLDSQRPECINPSLVNAATEIVVFRVDEDEALKALGKMRVDVKAVSNLPLGSFISYNKLTGGSLAGKIF